MENAIRAGNAAARSLARMLRLAGLLVVVTAIAGVLGHQVLASSSSTAASAIEAVRGGHGEGDSDGLGEDDGAVPAGTSVFDDGIPGVARLDPALLAAVRRAATDAAAVGVRFEVDSGWRSKAYQEHLFRQAVSKYGSEEAASRWVAPADASAHVSGHAIDIGPPSAAAWLAEHGVVYGLCRVYANEGWHFELRAAAPGSTCPPMYADAAQDPRMQR